MAAFASRMLEAKHDKTARRNRGESNGTHGMRRLILSERAEIDPPPGSWERLLAKTRIAWRGARTDAIEANRFATHEIRGDSLCIPF
jgi:hypothetical protein